MFKDITWLQFLGSLFLLLIAYYGYLAVAYYPHEIKAYFNSKRSRVPVTAGPGVELAATEVDEFTEQEDDEPDTVPDDESEAAPKVVLPTASLANLAAVTQAKATVDNSPEEEAEETYDDAQHFGSAEVGEGGVLETGVNSAIENLPFTEEPIVSTDSTTDIVSAQNEEKSANYSENDDMIPNNANFGTDGSAIVAYTSSGQDDLPPLQEDEPDHSISVTSLATHLGRITSGEITSAEELVAEVPNLADTDLLNSLYASALNESNKTLRTRLAGIEV